MREITASGQTVEEAKKNALEQLGLTEDQVTIDVIDEGKKGILGVFGSKKAYVKVTEKKNPIEDGKAFLLNISQEMNLSIEVKVIEQEDEVVFDLVGEKLGLLIGKRGQTINALQYLTHLVVNKDKENYVRVVVDAEDYRARRRETLESLAQKLANKALKLNKEVRLEPMPSFERRIIHAALHDHESVATYSDGKDPNRYIIIKPEKNV